MGKPVKFWLSDEIAIDCLLQAAETTAEWLPSIRLALPIGDGRREEIRAKVQELRRAVERVREARE